MLQAGSGTLLYTTGGGAISPYPFLATLNAAQAGLRNWVHNLHATLAGQGVYAATVAVNAMIADIAPGSIPTSPQTSSPRPTGTCTPSATASNRSSPPES
jgi:short-subunit dehydrogenase